MYHSQEYYVNHTFFLTGKPLYVICYDVTNVQPERLEYWFRTLQWIAGSSAHLILVGTHTDLLKDEKASIFFFFFFNIFWV